MNFLNAIKLSSIVRKSRKYTKKSKYDKDRISLQFRNDFLAKKVTKVFKAFNVNVSVKGYDNLGFGPALLVGNHQDNIDALVILYALRKNTEDKSILNKIPTFIAKHTLQYKATTRHPLNVINTFFLERNDLKKSLETYNEFGKFVKENKTFGVIFPEGTRNRNEDIGEFKAGVFKIAKKELLPIIPFTINNSVSGLDEKRKEILNIEIIFHKKIPANSFMTQNTFAISERVHNIVKSEFKKPEHKFIESESENNIEESRAAIKWHNKENKKIVKQAKKERREREQERKLIEAEEKENQRYEKYREKKLLKQQKKEGKKDE